MNQQYDPSARHSAATNDSSPNNNTRRNTQYHPDVKSRFLATLVILLSWSNLVDATHRVKTKTPTLSISPSPEFRNSDAPSIVPTEESSHDDDDDATTNVTMPLLDFQFYCNDTSSWCDDTKRPFNNRTRMNELMESFMMQFFTESSTYRETFEGVELQTVNPNKIRSNTTTTTTNSTKNDSNHKKETKDEEETTPKDDDKETTKKEKGKDRRTLLPNETETNHFQVSGYAYFRGQSNTTTIHSSSNIYQRNATTASSNVTIAPSELQLEGIMIAYFSLGGNDHLIQHFNESTATITQIQVLVNEVIIEEQKDDTNNTQPKNDTDSSSNDINGVESNNYNNNNSATTKTSASKSIFTNKYVIAGMVVTVAIVTVVVAILLIAVQRRRRCLILDTENTTNRDDDDVVFVDEIAPPTKKNWDHDDDDIQIIQSSVILSTKLLCTKTTDDERQQNRQYPGEDSYGGEIKNHHDNTSPPIEKTDDDDYNDSNSYNLGIQAFTLPPSAQYRRKIDTSKNGTNTKSLPISATEAALNTTFPMDDELSTDQEDDSGHPHRTLLNNNNNERQPPEIPLSSLDAAPTTPPKQTRGGAMQSLRQLQKDVLALTGSAHRKSSSASSSSSSHLITRSFSVGTGSPSAAGTTSINSVERIAEYNSDTDIISIAGSSTFTSR